MVYFNKTVDVYKIKEGLERKNQRSSTSKYPIFDSGSESMNAIIHGENNNKSNHYIDGINSEIQPYKDLKETMLQLIKSRGRKKKNLKRRTMREEEIMLYYANIK